MAKQLNISLLVDADTKRAKAAFQDLQKTLTNIQASAMTDSKNTFKIDEIKKASEAARELQHNLAAATDINTGRLNLSTFSNALKKSGKDLSEYKTQLEALGPAGEQAFVKVAKSIAIADNPLKKTNGLLNEFKTTLMNTARWQLSSSILHGFMGSIQSAYGYAQDLNESLNNIRIVTGQNVDQMAQFAKEANNAAKALSTTTTDYTNASLIYYQQGLSEEEVKARTDTTIKLANVSRQSAEEVSSQMTAIWNNFADGAENLEYYADVITKLGATTASSSDEIAQGLEKFASVADTVGLSYEKASSALATVVAETRQSADVVGTAFKTLFARVEGLKLGETLEDGVDLNKYSKALDTVGVKILDANKQIKSMDNILDELGAKWDNIGKSEQIALAQTVAGVRQYTQFIALMDNYDKVQKNEDIARGSAGTIQEQADIYAESWEAASKRVKASLETIYQSLIDDKFFIGLNNTFATLLEGVNGFIKGLGGIKGILSTVAAFIGQSLAKEAPAALQKITGYVTQITGMARKDGQTMQTKIQKWASEEIPKANAEYEALDTAGPNASEYMVQVNMIEILAEKKRQYNANEAQYSEEEKKRAQEEIAALEASGNALELKAQGLDNLRKRANQTTDSLVMMAKTGDASQGIFDLRSVSKVAGQIQSLSSQLDNLNKKYKNGSISEEDYKKGLFSIKNQAKKAGDELGGPFKKRINDLNIDLERGHLTTEKMGKYLGEHLKVGAQQADTEIENLIGDLQDFGIPETALRNFVQILKEVGVKAEEIPSLLKQLKNSMGDLATHTSKSSEQLMSFASALMQINAITSSITRLKDVFSDEDASAVEKVGAVIGLLTTALFTFNAISKLTKVIQSAETGSIVANILARKAQNGEIKKGLGNWLANIYQIKTDSTETNVNTGAKIANKVATDGLNVSLKATLVTAGLLTAAFFALTAIIAIVSAAIKFATEAYNADAIAAEKANKAAQELSETYNETKEAYDKLKESIEKYQTAYNAIAQLQKGTDSFKQAIIEANEEALNLINTYKDLNYTIDENGTIKISDSSLQKIAEKQTENLSAAYSAKIIAQANANIASTQAEITRTGRGQGAEYLEQKIFDSQPGMGENSKQWAFNSINGKAISASFGKENVNNAVIRLTSGDLAKQFKNNLLTDEMLKTELQIDDDELIDSIKELAKEVNHNSEVQDLAIEQSVNYALSTNKNIQNSKYKDAVSVFSQGSYNETFEKAKNETYFETSFSNKEKATEYLKQYANLKGLDSSKISYVDNKDGVLKYAYDGENGREEKDISVEALRQLLSANAANEELSKTANEVLSILKQGNVNQANALSALHSNDVSKMSVQDLINTKEDGFNFINEELSDEEIGKLNIIDEKTGKIIKDREKIIKLLQQQSQDTIDNLIKYGERQGQVVGSIVENMLNGNNNIFKNISQEDIQNYAEKLGQVLISGGEEAVNELDSGITQLMTDNKDKAKEIMKAASGIDWNQKGALEQFNGKLQEIGISINKNGEAWKKITNGFEHINIAIEPQDIKIVRTQLTELAKLAKDIKVGSIIKDEDFEKLVKLKPELRDLFITTAEGMQYIGSQDLSTIVKEANANYMNDLIKDNAQARNTEEWVSGQKKENENWSDYQGKEHQNTAFQKYQELLTSNQEKFNQLLETVGTNREILDEAFSTLQNPWGKNKEDIKAAQEKIDTFYGKIIQLENDVASGAYDDKAALEVFATSVDNVEEMIERVNSIEGITDEERASLIEKATIAIDQKNVEAAIEKAQTLQELQMAIGASGADNAAFQDEYSNGLIKMASQYESCSEATEKYQSALTALAEARGEDREALEEEVQKAQEELEVLVKIEEAAKKYNLEADTLASHMNEIANTEELTKKQALELAISNERMNRGVASLVNNWKDWKNTLKTTKKTAEDYAATLADVSNAVTELVGWYEDLNLNSEFVEKHMNLIDKAAQGDTRAILKLGAAVASQSVAEAELNETLGEKLENGERVASAFQIYADSIGMATDAAAAFAQLQTDVQGGFDTIANNIDRLANGASLADIMGGEEGLRNWVEQLNAYASATGMTADAMQQMLQSVGVTAHVERDYQEQDIKVPTYKEVSIKTGEKKFSYEGFDGQGHETTIPEIYHATVPGPPLETKGYVEVASIQMEGKDGSGPKVIPPIFTGKQAPSSTAMTGGTGNQKGNSSSKSSTPTTKASSHNHEVKRYQDEENAINGLTKELERLSKIKDNAFGAGKIQAIELEIKKMKELKNASKDYLEAIVGAGNGDLIAKTLYNGGSISSLISSGQLGGTIGADYRALFSGTSASGKNLEYTAKDSAGNERLVEEGFNINDWGSMFGGAINYQLDSYGNITNQDAILKEIEAKINEENDIFSRYADPDAGSTTDHNRRLAFLEEVKERISQYGTTISDLMEHADDYLEQIASVQDANAELISTKLNTGVALSDKSLSRLERALKMLGDDIYRSTEKMATWFDTKMTKNNAEYTKQAQYNIDAMRDIQERVELYKQNPLDENAISPEKAAEMLSEIESSLDDLTDKQLADIKELEEAYGNTLDTWKEKISEVTKSIEFNINTLSHLRKVFDLLGLSADREKLGKLLNEQAYAAQVNYDQSKERRQDIEKDYKEHFEYSQTLTGEELERYQEVVLKKDKALLEEVTQEEQANLEALIEAQKAIHENNIDKIYEDYEKTMAGKYGSFDVLDASMERQQSLADEYLTKTNQIYESNKMLRKLQQDIDKTDSQIAKKKLKDFSNEIEALKSREKLSKADLELAKAKYEMLQAQIALEEAQNAKSTVRLQRDSEGNYGYVYTADQDLVSDAEQKVDDTENNYYNVLLQQYNDYTQKGLQSRQEYAEAKRALDQAYYEDHTITEEQYLQSLEELNNNFQEKELLNKDITNTRGTELDQVAATDRHEAWTNMYEDIALDRDMFNEETTGAAQQLCDDVTNEEERWAEIHAYLAEEAGANNEQLGQTFAQVREEVRQLGDQITKDGGLVDQFDEMRDYTYDLTQEFLNQYDALMNDAEAFSAAANEASNLQTYIMGLTTAQLQYNAALAAQPSTAYSTGSTSSYGNNGSGDGSSGNGSSSDGITNNSGNSIEKSSCPPHNYQFHGNEWNTRYNSGTTEWQLVKIFKCSKCGKVISKYDDWRTYQAHDMRYHISNSYKTGGYTGSWNGPDLEENGKLAFLHQKELVLNADDTENMLSAVKMIRQISQIIDLQAAAQSSNYVAQAAQFTGNEQVLQQEVTIHAEFPNVNDHNEIEEAFNNLVNKAAQFANRS